MNMLLRFLFAESMIAMKLGLIFRAHELFDKIPHWNCNPWTFSFPFYRKWLKRETYLIVSETDVHGRTKLRNVWHRQSLIRDIERVGNLFWERVIETWTNLVIFLLELGKSCRELLWCIVVLQVILIVTIWIRGIIQF
jgi:hypothetical protein